MNTFLDYLGVAVLFTVIMLPTLVGMAHERRVDRQLRDAERGARPDPQGSERTGSGPAIRKWFDDQHHHLQRTPVTSQALTVVSGPLVRK